MKRIMYIFFILGFCVLALPGFQSSVVVQTPHSDTILDIAVHPSMPLLFSAGADGCVLVYDTERNLVIRRLQVSPYSLERIAVHPDGEEIAVLVHTGDDAYLLEGYEWRSGTRLFSRHLQERPLSLSYSPKGTYIGLTFPTWRSFSPYSSKGTPISFFSQGFGIVSFFFFSSTESTLVTYTPASSLLIYWDTKTRREKARVSLQEKVEDPVLYSPRLLVGKTQERLVVLDMVTGKVFADVPLREIRDIQVDPEKEIVVVQGSSFPSLIRYRLQGQSLVEEERIPLAGILSSAVSLALKDGILYAGMNDGTVRRFSLPTKLETAITTHLETSITDLAVHEDRIFCSTRDFVVEWDATSIGDRTEQLVTSRRLALPFQRNTALSIAGGTLAVWTTAPPDPPVVMFYDLSSRSLKGQYRALSTYPSSVLLDEERIIILERNTSIRVLDPVTLGETLRIPGNGILDMALSDGILFAGRTQTSLTPYSLLKIDLLFGETLPLENRMSVIYRLVLDPSRNVLYGLGLTQDHVTAIERFRISGERISSSRVYTSTIFDPEGDITFEPDTGSLYTTAGYTTPLLLSGSRRLLFEATSHLPRRLFLSRGILYAVNRDGSVSIWDANTRSHLYDVVLFADGEWLIEGRDGLLLSSSERVQERYLPAQ